jgi:hypothetical protein
MLQILVLLTPAVAALVVELLVEMHQVEPVDRAS